MKHSCIVTPHLCEVAFAHLRVLVSLGCDYSVQVYIHLYHGRIRHLAEHLLPSNIKENPGVTMLDSRELVSMDELTD